MRVCVYKVNEMYYLPLVELASTDTVNFKNGVYKACLRFSVHNHDDWVLNWVVDDRKANLPIETTLDIKVVNKWYSDYYASHIVDGIYTLFQARSYAHSQGVMISKPGRWEKIPHKGNTAFERELITRPPSEFIKTFDIKKLPYNYPKKG